MIARPWLWPTRPNQNWSRVDPGGSGRTVLEAMRATHAVREKLYPVTSAQIGRSVPKPGSWCACFQPLHCMCRNQKQRQPESDGQEVRRATCLTHVARTLASILLDLDLQMHVAACSVGSQGMHVCTFRRECCCSAGLPLGWGAACHSSICNTSALVGRFRTCLNQCCRLTFQHQHAGFGRWSSRDSLVRPGQGQAMHSHEAGCVLRRAQRLCSMPASMQVDAVMVTYVANRSKACL